MPPPSQPALGVLTWISAAICPLLSPPHLVAISHTPCSPPLVCLSTAGADQPPPWELYQKPKERKKWFLLLKVRNDESSEIQNSVFWWRLHPHQFKDNPPAPASPHPPILKDSIVSSDQLLGFLLRVLPPSTIQSLQNSALTVGQGLG